MRELGQNKKTKHARAVNRMNRKANKLGNHADGHCGNYACDRCFPNKKETGVAKFVKKAA
jgi:hypothetical protein